MRQDPIREEVRRLVGRDPIEALPEDWDAFRSISIENSLRLFFGVEALLPRNGRNRVRALDWLREHARHPTSPRACKAFFDGAWEMSSRWFYWVRRRLDEEAGAPATEGEQKTENGGNG